MRVLSIETATAVCAAAVIEEGRVLAERSIHEQRVHAEKLITIIDEVLRASAGYDVIAVSIGPGSFTGLRIGLSVAKGLACGSGKPIVAVSTLEALAFRAVYEALAGSGDQIIAMIDARRRDVYAAGFRYEQNALLPLFDARAISIPELVYFIPTEHPLICMGDGAEKLWEFHSDTGARLQLHLPPLEKRLCSAAAVGILGERKARQGEYVDVSSVEPLYGKDFSTLVKTQHVH